MTTYEVNTDGFQSVTVHNVEGVSIVPNFVRFIDDKGYDIYAVPTSLDPSWRRVDTPDVTTEEIQKFLAQMRQYRDSVAALVKLTQGE